MIYSPVADGQKENWHDVDREANPHGVEFVGPQGIKDGPTIVNPGSLNDLDVTENKQLRRGEN